MKLEKITGWVVAGGCALWLWAGLGSVAAAQNMAAVSSHLKPGAERVLSEGVSSMNVTAGKSTLLRLPQAITRISVGNPKVADVALINPSEIYILGKMIGTTNLILWTRNGPTRVIDVTVLMDAAALQNKLQEIMPEEQDIQVSAAGDSLVLSGTVSNTVKVDRAVALADTYIRTSILGMMMSLEGGGQGDGTQGNMGGQQGLQALRQGLQTDEDSPGAGAGLGSIRIVNLLRVRDNQQVMLEVKVAEVNRTIAEKLGFDFARAARKTGSAWTQVMAGVIGGGPANLLFGKNLSADVNLGLDRVNNAVMDKGTAFLMDAEKRDELIKVLAEPNIVAISGQEASFLVGGEIMIPVPGMAQVTLESKQFGVGLRFTPTVLEEGRIHLRVTPEVSELVGFNEVASSGFGAIVAIPTFKTRRISTTVQLADGQSLAIGGLLQDDFKEQMKRFPMLGEVPVLGTLFRSSEYQMNKTELMIVVTPRLVKPLQPDYALPTDAFIEPGRGEFLIQGRMESASDQARPRAAGYPAEAGGFQMK
ncbi:type II and III secretion system protein family protein [Nitrosomonas sp. ANs5]|uniref:type II and III secretion system protein family protein n=1 Tax=Nitrosomonas sp. ANs5 TaxID=3423941 RepID=UPI003D34FB07